MEEEWKRLSEKEFQIMTYMWEENHPLTMNEIREKIGTQGKPANVSTTGSQIRGLETAEEYEARLEKERTEKRRSHYSRKKEKQQEREEPEEEEELER